MWSAAHLRELLLPAFPHWGGEVCFIGAAIRVLTLSPQLWILKVSFVLKLNDFLCSDSYLQIVQISQELQEPLQELVWEMLGQILKS